MTTGIYPRPTIEERFWRKVENTATCWLWTASKDRGGYGYFWNTHIMGKAHRFSYELLVGPIPEELQLDHLCRVRHCVNPAHLEPVTQRENVLRGLAAINKTHCERGHPLIAGNLYTYQRPDGHAWRQCRTCAITKQRAKRTPKTKDIK